MKVLCEWGQNGTFHQAVLSKEEAMRVYLLLQPALNIGIAFWINKPVPDDYVIEGQPQYEEII